MTRMQFGKFAIDIHRERVEVTSMGPRPDPDWFFIDDFRHSHRWSTEHETFEWVQDEPDYLDEDGEEYPGDGHYECLRCHRPVTPGMRGPSTYREYMAGPISMSVEFSDGLVTYLTREEFDAARLRPDEPKEDMERRLRAIVDRREDKDEGEGTT